MDPCEAGKWLANWIRVLYNHADASGQELDGLVSFFSFMVATGSAIQVLG